MKLHTLSITLALTANSIEPFIAATAPHAVALSLAGIDGAIVYRST